MARAVRTAVPVLVLPVALLQPVRRMLRHRRAVTATPPVRAQTTWAAAVRAQRGDEVEWTTTGLLS